MHLWIYPYVLSYTLFAMESPGEREALETIRRLGVVRPLDLEQRGTREAGSTASW